MVNGFNKVKLAKDTGVDPEKTAAPTAAPSAIAQTKPEADAPLLAGADEEETPAPKSKLNSIADAYKKAMLA